MNVREFFENYDIEIWEVRNSRTEELIEYKICLLEDKQAGIDWSSVATDVVSGEYNKRLAYFLFYTPSDSSDKGIINMNYTDLEKARDTAKDLPVDLVDMTKISAFTINKTSKYDGTGMPSGKLINPDVGLYLNQKSTIIVNTSYAGNIVISNLGDLLEMAKKEYEFLLNEEENTKKLTKAQSDLLKYLGGK